MKSKKKKQQGFLLYFSRTQNHSTELLKLDTERAAERDILSQQIEGLKAELRTVRTDAAKRLQEQEEHAQQQLSATQEQLRVILFHKIYLIFFSFF